MSWATTIATLVAAVAVTACSENSPQKVEGQESAPILQKASLECSGEMLISPYSFEMAETASKREADIILYFDSDDCSQGAILGQTDKKGFLFPVGHRSWDEMSLHDLPQEGATSVIGFRPITKDDEGLGFWVKTKGERYALVRIQSVRPASHSELASGKTAGVDVEWAWGVPEEERK